MATENSKQATRALDAPGYMATESFKQVQPTENYAVVIRAVANELLALDFGEGEDTSHLWYFP